MDWNYLIIGGFFVEILTEMIKKLLKLEGGWVLIFAIIFGILFSLMTIPQTLKYQLQWSAEIPDSFSAIITGIVISSLAKFYDYVFKFTNLKSKNE